MGGDPSANLASRGASLGQLGRLAALALFLAGVLSGCWWEQGGIDMPVSNYTGSDIVIVHRADNGNETPIVANSTGSSTIRAGAGTAGMGLIVRLSSAQCDSGSLIARTVDGNQEVARRTITPTSPYLCDAWIFGTPPASASPAPGGTPRMPAPSATP